MQCQSDLQSQVCTPSRSPLQHTECILQAHRSDQPVKVQRTPVGGQQHQLTQALACCELQQAASVQAHSGTASSQVHSHAEACRQLRWVKRSLHARH